MIPVTVIVLTYNEEVNIGRCLGALHAFEDIVVVDSGSKDSTLNTIREDFPKVRVYDHPFDDFGQQRNWALDETDAKFDWVLFIDADEFMEEPLVSEITEFVANPQGKVGGFIAGRNYFLGTWLKHCTFYPSFQLRLLKRGDVRYRKEGHGQREVTDGELDYLTASWRHEGFSKGLHQWIARHNNYSSNEVELLLRLRDEKLSVGGMFSLDSIKRRRALKVLGAKLPGRPLTRFLYTYVLRLGFLDGRAGFVFCQLRFAHDCHILAKIAERQEAVKPSSL